MVLKHVFLFCSFVVVAFSCGNTESTLPPNSPKEEVEGEVLYRKTCKLCHGKDGDKGLSDATDLTTSTLTPEEAENVLKNGRNKMAGYKDVYTQTEIDALIAYIQTLRK